MRRILLGISYISVWILASLGLAGIVNLGLIQSGAYINGDPAEIIVFALAGLLGLGGAASLFGEAFDKKISDDQSDVNKEEA